jgi:hypothetical protein
MPFETLNYKSFAQWWLFVSVNSWQTSCILLSWKWALFPNAFPFYAVLEELNDDLQIVKRETVKVTNIIWDTFTIERWQDWTTAQSFIWNKSRLSQNTVARDFVNLNEWINELRTVPWTAKTTPINADVFTIRDSVASFVIKKVTRQNIKTTLEAYFDMVYLWITDLRQWLTANKMLITDWSGNETYADLPGSVIKQAWENITQWNALRLWLGVFAGDSVSQLSTNGNSVDLGYSAVNYWGWQSIVFANWWILTSIANISLRKVWTPTWQIKLSIYDSTGATLLFTSSNSISEASITWTFVDYTFNFNNFVPAWTYRILVRADRAVNASNYSHLQLHSSNLYGTRFAVSSTIVRTSTRGAFRFTATVNALNEPVTSVFIALATWTHYSNLFWFANNTATTWNNVTVDMIYTNKMTWLTRDTNYFLSNTPWTISTTAWTVSRLVWRSISTTELLINLFW